MKVVKKIVRKGGFLYVLQSRFTVTIFLTFYCHDLPSLHRVSSFAMSSIGSSSIFAKANHFLPRSFNEAPIW